jgi:hypothetical protein
MYDAGAQAAADEYANASYEDLHDTGTECVTDGYDNDWVNNLLTPRPAVATDTDDGTGAGTTAPFEDKNGSVNTP